MGTVPTGQLRLIPGALIGVAAATTLAAVMALPVLHVAVPDRIWQSISIPDASLFGQLLQPDLLLPAIALAFVASTESLLSASAVDRMQDRARTQYDRELLAQGVGNGVAGLLGGLPITGVIVRSSANVQAGALTRLSTILHGVLILGFVSLLPGVLRLVPTAALAGVLVVTGWRLVSLRHVQDLLREHGRLPVAIWVATFVGVIATDLLTGVMIGLGCRSWSRSASCGVQASACGRSRPAPGPNCGLPERQRSCGCRSCCRRWKRRLWTSRWCIRTRGLRHMDHTFASVLHQAASRSERRRAACYRCLKRRQPDWNGLVIQMFMKTMS